MLTAKIFVKDIVAILQRLGVDVPNLDEETLERKFPAPAEISVKFARTVSASVTEKKLKQYFGENYEKLPDDAKSTVKASVDETVDADEIEKYFLKGYTIALQERARKAYLKSLAKESGVTPEKKASSGDGDAAVIVNL